MAAQLGPVSQSSGAGVHGRGTQTFEEGWPDSLGCMFEEDAIKRKLGKLLTGFNSATGRKCSGAERGGREWGGKWERMRGEKRRKEDCSGDCPGRRKQNRRKPHSSSSGVLVFLQRPLWAGSGRKPGGKGQKLLEKTLSQPQRKAHSQPRDNSAGPSTLQWLSSVNSR